VAQQQLHGAQVTDLTIYQCRLCAPQRVRPEEIRVEADRVEPVQEQPSVLSRRHAATAAAPTAEEEVPRLPPVLREVFMTTPREPSSCITDWRPIVLLPSSNPLAGNPSAQHHPRTARGWL
jgi:hypothetical protein